MANDIIKLDTLSPNFHRLNSAMGGKSWFSYGTLIAAKISDASDTVFITPVFHSVTTSKHLNTVKRWADENGLTVQVADDEDTLNGWAA